jgi:hypothetical protein
MPSAYIYLASLPCRIWQGPSEASAHLTMHCQRLDVDECRRWGRMTTMSNATPLIHQIRRRNVCILLAVSSLVGACAPPCDRREDFLAADASGRSVVSKFDCTSTESVELRSETGRETTIFKYESSGGIAGCKGKTFPRATETSPTVNWSDSRVIRISIGVIGRVDRQLDEVDGVRVTYDIGSVISESCQNTAL